MLLAVLALAGTACNSAKTFGPKTIPALRAASASDFAVEVEFPAPLEPASASDAGRFRVYLRGDSASPVPIYSAQIADSFYGRVALLLLSGGPLTDSARYVVETRGIRDVYGRAIPDGRAEFDAGLRYATDIAPLFADRCNACHGPSRAEGAYRTDSRNALYGAGTDATPDLIEGNPSSILVRKTRPGRSMYLAGGLEPLDADIVQNWVVNYLARP